MQKKIQKDWVSVAKIGRCVGVKGQVLLHLLTDFPQSIKPSCSFFTDFCDLQLESYDKNRFLAKFSNIDSKEEAQKLVNLILYTTQDSTRSLCVLKKDEFFWFDIIESKIFENNEFLGVVSEIERFGSEDYLVIKTAQNLVDRGFVRSFMIPYTKRYILEVKDTNPKEISVQFCKEILENS